MNRFQEIDQFLKYYATIYFQNPQLEITYDTLYDALATYGLNDSYSIEECFPHWMNQFYNSNLAVYKDPSQTSFLQFQSRNITTQQYDCVKLYLNFPRNTIEQCVSVLFDFIKKNNMPTLSKVADESRADSVIVRLVHIEDAKKVIDFINQSPLLHDNIGPVNPFLMRSGKIGMACDHLMSYNLVLSILLQDYFRLARNTNSLTQVSYESFHQFVQEQVKNFNNIDNMQALLNQSDIKRYRKYFESEGAYLVNCSQIFDLISLSLNPYAKEADYFDHVKDCNNFANIDQYITYYNQSINQPISIYQIMDIVNSYIVFAYRQYGFGEVEKYLISYIEGNTLAITRQFGFREQFQRYISPTLLDQILPNNIQAYVETVLQNYGILSNTIATSRQF